MEKVERKDYVGINIKDEAGQVVCSGFVTQSYSLIKSLDDWHDASFTQMFTLAPKKSRPNDPDTVQFTFTAKSNSIYGDITNQQILIPRCMRGMRLGTYAMDNIVAWIQSFNDTPLVKVNVTSVDASAGNKDLRNRFYESFGIEFDWEDDGRNGTSKPMMTHDLIRNIGWVETVEEVHYGKLCSQLILSNNCLERRNEDLALTISQLRKSNTELRENAITKGLGALSVRATAIAAGISIPAIFAYALLAGNI